MKTESEVYTADTLKAYSDTCDDKPEYKFVCSEFSKWEPFTFSGLNECPHRFRPAIAMLAAEYASLQITEKDDLIRRLEDAVRIVTDKWSALGAQNIELRKERDHLQKFKNYVHDRLDKMGVPVDPEPDSNASHGCRIEGRLNFIESSLTPHP